MGRAFCDRTPAVSYIKLGFREGANVSVSTTGLLPLVNQRSICLISLTSACKRLLACSWDSWESCVAKDRRIKFTSTHFRNFQCFSENIFWRNKIRKLNKCTAASDSAACQVTWSVRTIWDKFCNCCERPRGIASWDATSENSDWLKWTKKQTAGRSRFDTTYDRQIGRIEQHGPRQSNSSEYGRGKYRRLFSEMCGDFIFN